MWHYWYVLLQNIIGDSIKYTSLSHVLLVYILFQATTSRELLSQFSTCSGWRWLNPLSPHDALKHHFTFLKTYLIFLQLGVSEWISPWNCLPTHGNFFYFFTHSKSCSSTTSRELRQRFAACSGWRWQCKVRLERVKVGGKLMKIAMYW